MTKQLFKKNSSKGFTFIEFLIYSGIVTVVIGGMIMVNINILTGRARLVLMEEVNQNARIVMNNIAYSIRNAQEINSPNQGNTSSTLELSMAEAWQNPTIFNLSEGVILISRGGKDEDFLPLTTDLAIVSELEFFNVSQDSGPGTVRIKMVIEPQTPLESDAPVIRKTFYLTENIRK